MTSSILMRKKKFLLGRWLPSPPLEFLLKANDKKEGCIKVTTKKANFFYQRGQTPPMISPVVYSIWDQKSFKLVKMGGPTLSCLLQWSVILAWTAIRRMAGQTQAAFTGFVYQQGQTPPMVSPTASFGTVLEEVRMGEDGRPYVLRAILVEPRMSPEREGEEGRDPSK